jgi:maltose alpha-D-glucosyltransferase/alpha-amylase
MKMEEGNSGSEGYKPPVFESAFEWSGLVPGEEGTDGRWLEEVVLPRYLPWCRWFGGKAKSVRTARVWDLIPVSADSLAARLCLIEVAYENEESEIYLLPLKIVDRETAQELATLSPTAVIAGDNGGERFLVDGIFDAEFRAALLGMIASGRRLKGVRGEVDGLWCPAFQEIVGEGSRALGSRVLKVEQSNSSIVYEDKFFLKLYRKLELGMNRHEPRGKCISPWLRRRITTLSLPKRYQPITNRPWSNQWTRL